MNRISFCLLLIVLFCFSDLSAQKRSRQYKSLRNDLIRSREIWKNRPVSFGLIISTQSIIGNKPNPATNMEMDLFIGESDYYVRTDRMEQLLEDSVWILVNSITKMILLSRVNDQFLSAFNNQINEQFHLQDSVLIRSNSDYELLEDSASQGQRCIVIRHKKRISETDIPKEEVKLFIDRKTAAPLRVEQFKASLVPIAESDAVDLMNNPDYKESLIKGNKDSFAPYYFISKVKTTFTYKNISANATSAPVKLKDRVVKDEEGNWKAAKDYEEYAVTIKDDF